MVCIDQKFHRIAGAILLFVGDQFEVAVAEISFLIVLSPAHGEHRRALLLAAFFVSELHRHPVLPGLGGDEIPVTALGLPLADFFLLDLPIRIERGGIQDRGCFAIDRFAIERACGKCAGDFFAKVRVTTIQPDSDAKRLTRREHRATANDAAARGIYYFRSN